MHEANMLLKKLDENREALVEIGRDAIKRGAEVGLVPSCRDVDPDREFAVGEFVEFDPLAKYGVDRDLIREKHLLSNEIAVALEDKGIIADAELSALLDGPIEDVDFDALRAALARLIVT
jgi:hypothetical protein